MGVGRCGHSAVGARLDLTTLVGVAVEEQFSVFGAAGAVTFSALSGVLLNVLLPARASTTAVDVNPAGAKPKDTA